MFEIKRPLTDLEVEMKEQNSKTESKKDMYLKFSNPYHYKYGKENPKIIRFELHAPENSDPVPCFKVQFESSGEVEYIPHSLAKGFPWEIIW